MALKDWKKVDSIKGIIIWRSKDWFTPEIEIAFFSRYGKDENWIVYYGGKSIIFKLKSQALKFAKNYMRKH